MRIPIIHHRGVFLLLLCLAAAPSVTFAQQAGFSITFEATGVASAEADHELQRQAIDALREALAARGAIRSEDPDWVFLVGAIDVEQGDADQVVLSVATLHTLPEQAIQWGKEAEIFYASLSADRQAALPEEGTRVRQHLSEEFMRGFATVQDNDLVIVGRSESELEAGMSEIVDRFYRRHTRP